MMKKSSLRFCLIAVSALLSMVSCDRGLMDFADRFVAVVNYGNSAALVSMYPGAAELDIVKPIVPEPGTIGVSKAEDGHKVIHLGSISLDVRKSDAGNLEIVNSWGLLSIQDDMKDFATSTGWYDAERSDLENAAVLKDDGFKDYVKEVLKGSLKHLSVNTTESDWGEFNNYQVTTNAIVKNNSDVDIPGELYYVVMKKSYLTGEEYDSHGNFTGYGSASTYVSFPGRTVQAHGTVTIFVDKSDFEYGPRFYGPTIVFNNKCDVTKVQYPFTGMEYENYLASKDPQ